MDIRVAARLEHCSGRPRNFGILESVEFALQLGQTVFSAAMPAEAELQHLGTLRQWEVKSAVNRVDQVEL
jgi:hypothetical protein